MSILIKGVSLDDFKPICPCLNGEYGCCDIPWVKQCYGIGKDGCPLVEIPPHGRLIDADALMHEFEKAQRTMEQHGQEYSCSFMSSSQELSTEWYCVEDMLENAPTILEAEEDE